MSEERPRDAAMADILASIRRIVAEEDRRFASSSLASLGDVLELTPEMRVGPPGEVGPRSGAARSFGGAHAAEPPQPAGRAETTTNPRIEADDLPRSEADSRVQRAAERDLPHEVASPPLSIDDAHIAEIARAIVRQELAGAFGQTLTRNVKALIKDEVARALAAREPSDE